MSSEGVALKAHSAISDPQTIPTVVLRRYAVYFTKFHYIKIYVKVSYTADVHSTFDQEVLKCTFYLSISYTLSLIFNQYFTIYL